MSEPDRPRDRGAQPERTGLAWQRTALSGLACSLVVAKLVSARSLTLGVVLAALALITTAIIFAVSHRRYRATLTLFDTGPLPDGRLNAVAALLIVITAAGAATYAVLLHAPTGP